MIIPANITQRVFCFKTPAGQYGTCFGVAIKDKICLVTAKHLLKTYPTNKKLSIKIFIDNIWKNATVTPHFENNDLDIAIMISDDFHTHVNDVVIKAGHGIILSQEVFFLGFPYFDQITYEAISMNKGLPIPLVKKAIISYVHKNIIYLDGHNNIGFSGGPVVFYDYKSNEWKVCSVISSYMTDIERPVKSKTSNPTGFYQENSGIIKSYTIGNVINLIEKHYEEKPNYLGINKLGSQMG